MVPGLRGKVQVAESESNRDQRISALPGQQSQQQEALPWQAATSAHMQRYCTHTHTHTVSGGKLN